MNVCVCVCARARARARVSLRACVRACVSVYVCVEGEGGCMHANAVRVSCRLRCVYVCARNTDSVSISTELSKATDNCY